MKRKMISPSKSEAVAALNALVDELNAARRKAKASGVGLVELDRALSRARKLRREIRDGKAKTFNWKRMINSVVLAAEVVKKLYSVLSFLRTYSYEAWRGHQRLTH